MPVCNDADTKTLNKIVSKIHAFRWRHKNNVTSRFIIVIRPISSWKIFCQVITVMLYTTLVCLNLGMASVARFLKFPIFRKIDVFLDPKIPNFLENWCFSDKKLWFLEFFDKKWWFLGQFYKLYNSLQTWPFQYQSWILAGQTFWFLKIWLIYEPWTIEIWFYGP